MKRGYAPWIMKTESLGSKQIQKGPYLSFATARWRWLLLKMVRAFAGTTGLLILPSYYDEVAGTSRVNQEEIYIIWDGKPFSSLNGEGRYDK